MPTVYKEVTVEIETDIELEDFETEDLITELDARLSNGTIPIPADAWFDLSTTGVPLNVVLHDLFKDCEGYSYSALESIINNHRG